MATNRTKGSRSGNQKKQTDKNPIAFVPLNGLSQSARDRQMNSRTVKRPKNLDLIEGEAGDDMDYQKTGEITGFPSEYLLSATIKEVNGTDYSNHAIEEYYRNRSDSGSISPDISDDYTISSSNTNDSVVCVSESQEETFSSSISDSTAPQSQNTENEPQNAGSMDSDEMNDALSKCRYSKNAAIMGLLKQNLITFDDLNLVVGNKKKDSETAESARGEQNGKNNGVNDAGGKSEVAPDRIADYPYLVPHPDDPEFFTHPLQAYGRVDDAGINFQLPRLGTKTIITPRDYFIRQGLNVENFQFQPKIRTESTAAKPKLNVKIPKIRKSRPSSKQSNNSAEANTSYDSFGNNENEGFRLNCEEFPSLMR